MGAALSSKIYKDAADELYGVLQRITAKNPAAECGIRTLAPCDRSKCYEAILKPLSELSVKLDDHRALRNAFMSMPPSQFADVLCAMGTKLDSAPKAWMLAIEAIETSVGKAVRQPDKRQLFELECVIDVAKKVAGGHVGWQARLDGAASKIDAALTPILKAVTLPNVAEINRPELG